MTPGRAGRPSKARGEDLDGGLLARALPQRDGVGVLAFDRTSGWAPSEGLPESVIPSLTKVCSNVVVTLPCGPAGAALSSICDVVVVLVNGSVAGVAAASQAVAWLTTDRLGVITLQAPAAQRHEIAESLNGALIDGAHARWNLAHSAAADVANGRWPGASDRTLRRLAASGADALATARRLAWA